MRPEGAILAFDFGASSGRCIAGRLEGDSLEVEIVHRFANRPVKLNGRFHWDILGLYREILEGLIIYRRDFGGKILSLAIDTWGVDYGLIGKDGRLLANPYHYRDTRTDAVPEKLFVTVPEDELYAAGGIQMMSINTVFQLFAEQQENRELFESARAVAMTPDLLNYFLTGRLRSELSIASTSALVDPVQRDWNRPLLKKLGYPEKLFTPIINPGEELGRITPDVEAFTGLKETRVFATTSHDTQSAIAAVPAESDDFIYLSSGTWSLMGVESDEPVLTPRAAKLGFTNEIGAGGKISLLTNIMGLWLIQECKRIWDREGRIFDYSELVEMAEGARDFAALINPMDPRFTAPENMPGEIRAAAAESGQEIPRSEAQITRCIFESLALVYRRTMERIEELTGKSYPVIHIVGGGVKNQLLCRMTAEACGRPVVAGPAEATALGNIIVQAAGQSLVSGLAEGRRLVSSSVKPEQYSPGKRSLWNQAYSRFCTLYPL
ncbi:rhamnulokinase family protein [Marispirochaeta sp.]|jgi:rhamnulokinase|uniref:rhamnulokinase n=1 Tax=Marispirochaeta sp. TaxID=2038653 RepID=UPI0029C76B47|nr:rhamnulokinase family protein [Marispirochaeta sp.]